MAMHLGATSRNKALRIGTRGSKLALWQAEHVAKRLTALGAGPVELEIIRTQGDKIIDQPLAALGGKGLFVKEIEEALAGGRADLAVHSLKDVPTRLAPGLVLGAILEREDPRDAWIAADGQTLSALPSGSRVGTSSLRRMCQLRAHRPDLQIEPLRGNVDTRIRRLDEGHWDAIVLAAAGLRRLGLEDRISELLSVDVSLPAIGQGAIAIEVRAEDVGAGALGACLQALHHAPTAAAVAAERALLSRLEGGCQTPIAGHATVEGNHLRLRALVGDADGKTILREEREAPLDQAGPLGETVAERLLELGAERLLRG